MKDKVKIKQKLSINFVDFWINFNIKDNFFYNLLSKEYKLVISSNPDILFYSCFGYEHLKYQCKKIFYTGENKKPDYNYCDYSFSFEDDSQKNFCLPHLVEFEHFFDFKDRKYNEKVNEYYNYPKTRFCSFMATNANAKERIEFVNQLMLYKKVDCSGPVLYNMNNNKNIDRVNIDWRMDKLETIKEYKFTISFENEQSYNYVTEKIYQPLLVGSIPIYWGAPNINEYFNSNCFIDVSKFQTFSDAIEYIKKVDQDIELYKSFFQEPAIKENSKLYKISEESILQFIKNVIELDFIPIGKKLYVKNIVIYYYKSIIDLFKNNFIKIIKFLLLK